MLDTTTYGLTKDLPGGPIYRSAEPMPHEIFCDEADGHPVTVGRVIGSVISLALLVAVGGYLFLAL
jgi:hypothetical protein